MFDLDAARKAGYDDATIAQGLAKAQGIDYDAALKAGYSPTDMLPALASTAGKSSLLDKASSAIKSSTSDSVMDKPGLLNSSLPVAGSDAISTDDKGLPTFASDKVANILTDDAIAKANNPVTKPIDTSMDQFNAALNSGIQKTPEQKLAGAIQATDGKFEKPMLPTPSISDVIADFSRASISGATSGIRGFDDQAASLALGLQGILNKAGLLSDEDLKQANYLPSQALDANNEADKDAYQGQYLPGKVAQGITGMAIPLAAGAAYPVAGAALFADQMGFGAGKEAIDKGRSLKNAQAQVITQAALGSVLGTAIGGGTSKVMSMIPGVKNLVVADAADTGVSYAKKIMSSLAQGAAVSVPFQAATGAANLGIDTATGEVDTNSDAYNLMPTADNAAMFSILHGVHPTTEYLQRNKMPDNVVILPKGDVTLSHNTGLPFTSPESAQEFIAANQIKDAGVIPVTEKSFDEKAKTDNPLGYMVKLNDSTMPSDAANTVAPHFAESPLRDVATQARSDAQNASDNLQNNQDNTAEKVMAAPDVDSAIEAMQAGTNIDKAAASDVLDAHQKATAAEQAATEHEATLGNNLETAAAGLPDLRAKAIEDAMDSIRSTPEETPASTELKAAIPDTPYDEGVDDAIKALQNRNRNSAASILQMNNIASNLNPRLLMSSPTMENGAPVVSDLKNSGVPAVTGKSDVVVTGKREIPFKYAVAEAKDIGTSNNADGTKNADYARNEKKLTAINNGRTAGVIEAYRRGNGEDYKQAIANATDLHGIDKDTILGMKEPVLVRKIDAEHVTSSIGDESNTTGTLGLSAVEQARNDARRVDIAGLDFNDDGRPTDESVRAFIHAMPEGERQNLAPNGKPTKQAIDRITGASLWHAYKSEELVDLAVQATDPESRTVITALTKSAPAMLGLDDAGDLDIRPMIVEAAKAAVNAARQGVSLTKFAQQRDLAHAGGTQAIIDFLARNVRSAKAMTERLNEVAKFIGEVAQHNSAGDMFGGSPASIDDVLRRFGNDTTSEKDLAGQGGGKLNEQSTEQEAAQSAGPSIDEATRAQAKEDFKEHLAEAGAIIRGLAGVNHIVPEEHEKLVPVMVKLFEDAFKIGYLDLKKATAYVRAELSKLGGDIAKKIRFLPNTLMERAAKEAFKNVQDQADQGLFGKQKGKTEKPAIPDTWKLADNKKEYVDDNGFVRGIEMSARERAAEQEFYDAILSDIHGLTEKYRTVVLKPSEGRLVDPDRIKELSDEFKADPSLAHAVHEPSSYLSKHIFEQWVSDDIDKPAVFTAGGGGSGKTEAMSTAQKVAGINPEGVIFDSTLSSFASATKKINQILNAGGKATVVYTNTPIVKAFNFAAGRKRVVPISVLAHAHQGASDTIRALSTHYKDNQNVEIVIINNNGELSEIHQGSIDEVHKYDYNETVRSLHEIAKEKLASGNITQERFDALTNGLSEGVKNEQPQQQRSVQQDGKGSLGSLQEGESQSQSERLRGRSSGNQEDGGLQSEVSQSQLGAEREHSPNSASSDEGTGSAPVQPTESDRQAGSVHEEPVTRDLFANTLPSTTDSTKARNGSTGKNVAGERGNNERGNSTGAGNRAARNAGVPAGRDIPAKSGLNYYFNDADLNYIGSWMTKARQNVEAVELIHKLNEENRQATPDEQSVLAKFIGWGSSEIRNNIFDPKLDDRMDLINKYQQAINEIGDKPGLTSYNGGFWNAYEVLKAKDPTLSYQDIKYKTITKAMLDAAKPDINLKQWADLRDRLKAKMSDEDWTTAERSTQYAHFSGKDIVRPLWGALDRLGFKGGSVLEPGAGIGVFPGLMDRAMANNSIYTGIEYDKFTGSILKQLFPDERILNESFIDSALPDNFYDVAIGNPPFSNTPILADPRYKKLGLSLHDYFFAKSLDKVKPGGVLMFITSRYTMDKMGDKGRKYMADRADLIGAIRLPETAFKKNAGTEVVTDVLFLRKRVPGENYQGHDWMKLAPVKTKGGESNINEYFAAHPEMVLGTHDVGRGMYSDNEYTVRPNKDSSLEDQLNGAIAKLPEGVYKPNPKTSSQDAQVREIDWNPKAQKEGNYYVADDGRLMQVENRSGIPADHVADKDMPMVKDFVKLRDALNQAQYDQLNNGDWETSLKALKSEYDAFVKKHGNLQQNTVIERKVKREDEDTGEMVDDIATSRKFTLAPKLNDDPEYTKVMALENLNDDTGEIKPSNFLTERTLEKAKQAKIDTPHDAMLSVLNDTGKVNIPMIAERMDLPEKDVISALGTSIYESPDHGWQTADEYLSGNVKQKLAEAEAAAKTDKNFERNVEALKEAQPRPVPPSDITASLGMNWIPTDVYKQFLQEKTGVKANIDYNEHTGIWRVDPISGHGRIEATQDWGTPQRNAADIIEHALTGRPIRITKTEGSGDSKKSVFDSAATEAANQKLKQMKEAFNEWLWTDGDRSDKLVRLYNDKFNNIVPRSYDGIHLTLPGTTSTIKVFDHVKRGAWRIIQSGNTYLAHAVGSGKTWQMVISAMEQKRLGMINKPMMVVPNHMLQQFANEWMQLYPAARLMVADEKQFHTDNRRRFVSRVAMSDLDGVIITHSAFKLLDLDPEFKQKMISEEIDNLKNAVEAMQSEDGEKAGSRSRNPSVRDMQGRIEKLEQKLQDVMSSEGKDKNVRFDEMGVDQLYVDEAHEFRKLAFNTTRQVKGISATGSERAFDLYMKTRWLEEKHPGRSLIMASGTPVTNTLAEMHSIQRFMAPKVLEERGLKDFDSWASMFGQEHTEIEADAAGKYAPVTRFSKFVNVPELTQMFREFADVLTSEHLAEMLGDKRPKVQNGSRKLVVTPQVDDYQAYKEQLARRLAKSREWKPSRDEPNNPDPVIRIIGDGRLAAIDMRFVDPTLPNDPHSKLNTLIDGVIKLYHETKDNKYLDKAGKMEVNKGATQMVFSDLGFGAGVTENRGFNARAWFEKRLKDAGIPPNQVAFMSDFKKSDDKQKLFKDINTGVKKILVGSSKNMGTGVNAQQRLIGLHHLDTPWYPADLEQREGRIIRQGNKNPLVNIYAYSTKGSYDTVMWQLLARKQRFIDQALSGDSSVRSLDDLSEASQYQMATAMTSGDERAIRLAGLKSDIDKYDRLYRAHEENRMRMRESYNFANYTIDKSTRDLPKAEKLAEQVEDLSGDKFQAKVGDTLIKTRKDWGEAMLAKFKELSDSAHAGKVNVGEISGFPIDFAGRVDQNNDGKILGYYPDLHMRVGDDSQVLTKSTTDDAVGLAIRATNALSAIERRPEVLKQAIDESKSRMNSLESRMDAPFQFAEELANRKKEAAALEAEMIAPAAETWRNEEGDAGMHQLYRKGPVIENGHTVESATKALLDAHSGMDRRALQEMLNKDQARVVNSHAVDAPEDAKAYFDPRDGKTYFLADRIAEDSSPQELKGLVRHEIAVHALHLGKDDAEFKGILDQVNTLRKLGNKEVNAAFDHVPVDTPARDVAHETLAYLIEHSPELSPVKKFVGWFREQLRKLGWKTPLSVNDLRYMAQGALSKSFHEASFDEALKQSKGFESRNPRMNTDYERALNEAGIPLYSRSIPGAKLIEKSKGFVRDVLDSSAMRDLKMKTIPMSTGSEEAKADAQKFINNERAANHQWGKMTELLTKNFTPEQRKAMWEAADEQNVLMRTGKDTAGRGIDALPKDQQVVMKKLHAYAQELWGRAVDAGMVQGEGMPFWTPRMAVVIGEDGEFQRPESNGKQSTSTGEGGNIKTTASSLKQRKYLTAAETEAAMKGAIGDNAHLVRDILTMPLAMARLEKAIAGRELVNQLKSIGQVTGKDIISDSEGPNFTTIDHPAFYTFKPKMIDVVVSRAELADKGLSVKNGQVIKASPSLPLNGMDDGGKVMKSYRVAKDGTVTQMRPAEDQNGDVQFDRTPLFISRDWEGPLKAIMSKKDGVIYSAYMLLKSKAMTAIMSSPLTHNMVIAGRALAYDPAAILTLKGYFVGNTLAKDNALMTRAIKAGLVPMGANKNSMLDVTDIARGIGKPGGWGDPNESWINLGAQKLGNVFAPGLGDNVKARMDKFGDWYHHTLLWKQVGALQMYIFNDYSNYLMAKGHPQAAADAIAAHLANRYGGAVQRENMSEMARKALNVMLFSRSFNVGNVGSVKDTVFGMPAGMVAKLYKDVGQVAGNKAMAAARGKARMGLVADLGMSMIMTAATASAIQYMLQNQTVDDITNGYSRRLHDMFANIGNHPLTPDSYNPYRLLPTYDNEPGKQDRIDLGADAMGRHEYMRLPTGKVVEDLFGWILHAPDTFVKKMSPVMGALKQAITNDKGYGVPVEDPNGSLIKHLYEGLMHVIAAQVPLDTMKTAYDVMQGKGTELDTHKLVGFATGFSTSQGNPGGPEAAEAYDVADRMKAEKEYVMADVKRDLKYGDVDAAREKLKAIGFTNKEINLIVRKVERPKQGLSGSARQQFNRHANDDDRAKMQQLRNNK